MTWPCTLLTCEVIWWPFVTLPRRTMTFRTATKYLCHKLPRICSVCRNYYPVLSSFITYHRICNKSNTTGASCGKWTTCLYRAPGLTSWGFVLQSTWVDLLGVRVTEHLGWPLGGSCYRAPGLTSWGFVLLDLLLCSVLSLYCLSLFDLRLLITPMISSCFPWIDVDLVSLDHI
jgi:hypothetical protein